MRLWQLDIERVDFMDADVAREERDAVWSESAPLSHYDAVEARDALQTEKRFRTGGANSDATKCWIGYAFVKVKILAVPGPSGKTDVGILPNRCGPFLLLEGVKT